MTILIWYNVNCTDGLCWEHDPGGFFATAIYTNVAPPFVWYVNGYLVPDVYGDILGGYDIFGHWDGLGSPEVRCVATNGPLHETILVEDSDYAGMGHCPPSTTNIIGAAWTSTHNPTNATDHLPKVYPESITYYGPNCPPATNLIVKAGWTHNSALLWIRNLVRIITYDPQDDETDHCIGLVWQAGGSVNLYDYLADCCKPFADKFAYVVNGRPCEGTLEFGETPDEFHPKVLHVELCRKEDGETLDRMWVVVNANVVSDKFDDWYSDNSTNTSWTASLPLPCDHLTFFLGMAFSGPGGTGNWSSPHSLGNSYMHHDSAYETRTYTTSEHGNQATFNADGALMTSGIRAGTADLYAPYNSLGALRWNANHRDHDVRPYIWSLQLDGNPNEPTSISIPTHLNRPSLHQGEKAGKYLLCRPTIH